MSQFLHLFRASEAEQLQAMGTPERAQRSTQAWLAWIRELEAKGHLKDPGQPLERAGKAAPRDEADWASIVALYDRLMAATAPSAASRHFAPSRTVSVRRTTVPCGCDGRARAAARESSGRAHFSAALALARNAMERRSLEERMHVRRRDGIEDFNLHPPPWLAVCPPTQPAPWNPGTLAPRSPPPFNFLPFQFNNLP